MRASRTSRVPLGTHPIEQLHAPERAHRRAPEARAPVAAGRGAYAAIGARPAGLFLAGIYAMAVIYLWRTRERGQIADVVGQALQLQGETA